MKLFHRLGGLIMLLSLSVEPASGGEAAKKPKTEMLVYVGTYTGARSKGIYVSRLDLVSGRLSAAELAAQTTSPSFLALHPNGRFLYSVNEVANFNDKPGGAVSAFAIQRDTGRLELLNQQSSLGGGPCHIVVSKAGRATLVANYGGGSVASLPIEKDGGLGEAKSFVQHQGSSVNQQRQEGPHAHGIYLDKRNRFAFVPDLGLDKILIYKFDSIKGTLAPNIPPAATVKAGAGPRHFALHPGNRFGYVINEMDCTVTAFAFVAGRGVLNEIQTVSTLPEGQDVKAGYSTAEIFVHPSGKFLYGSNRGHDTIVAYAIDAKSGKLKLMEHESTQGRTPRNFNIDPTGSFLLAANQNSDSIVVFRIDPKTGALSSTGQKLEVPAPVCVTFLQIR